MKNKMKRIEILQKYLSAKTLYIKYHNKSILDELGAYQFREHQPFRLPKATRKGDENQPIDV